MLLWQQQPWHLCSSEAEPGCMSVECFQRAVLDADTQQRLIHMFAAVLSGSQVVNFCLYC